MDAAGKSTVAAGDAYGPCIDRLLGRALSCLDMESTSSSRGSFDRTWWCWKFTDFSAPRFQEGIYTLAWLFDSPLSPYPTQHRDRIVDRAGAAVHFWTGLQHADGSFDEAYPNERSLAATAFTGFYVGSGLKRLRPALPRDATDAALSAIEAGARWLTRNGEFHGVLSNHLAAAAGALQVAGDLIGTDRFRTGRDRYLQTIYDHQDAEEGWFREYGGADPGYQSHGMFYLAEIWRQTGDSELLGRLRRACEFIAWFAHPDGTLGGEYASRGTKFAYPAAFEILAPKTPAAAAVASHLRRCLAARRGVGGEQMDAWNLFPLLNNYLFAAEAAQAELQATSLPWQQAGATRVFRNAGMAVARRGSRVLAAGPGLGGALKLWDGVDGSLVYEDCGYAAFVSGGPISSQSPAEWSSDEAGGTVAFEVNAGFTGVPVIRFDSWRFLLFRAFTLSVGRWPGVSRWLKDRLVGALIRRKRPHPARLTRTIAFAPDGSLAVTDRLQGLTAPPIPLERHVPLHMGSTRYADRIDWIGARVACPAATLNADKAHRSVEIPVDESL